MAEHRRGHHHKHSSHHSNHNFHNKDHQDMHNKGSNTIKDLKWYLFWMVFYGLLIGFFGLITTKYDVVLKPIVYYLILGLILRVVSKFVYCAIKHKTFSFRRIISWSIIYALVLFIINFLIKEFIPPINQYLQLTLLSILFTILIMFLRRVDMNFGFNHRKFSKAPSQIFTGIALIVFGILCWRFSKMVFVDWFGWAEGMVWSWVIGLALIIGGILVLVAWWRNNVSDFNSQHNLKWRPKW